jgi:hypothetical protein
MNGCGRLWAAVAVFTLGPAEPAETWPVLSEPHVSAGLRCLPDDGDAGLWWYVRQELELAPSAGAPAFSLHRFRYTGSRVTGDSGASWGKGLMSLLVRFEAAADAVARAREEIGRTVGRPVRLRPLPIERVETSLLYVTAGDEPQHGELPRGGWEGDGVWTERAYTLGLPPLTTDLIWSASQAGGLALSLNYSIVGRGLAARPQSGEQQGPAPEPVTATVAGGALPIRVSPSECPRCFRSTDLDAEIPAGYTFLDLFCHDFQSAATPTDLALVVVEVRATAVSGERPVARHRFRPGGPARQAVHFEFAVRLEEGYEVRVIHVFADGRSQEGPWERVERWSGIRDVTSFAESAGRVEVLDPRMLY